MRFMPTMCFIIFIRPPPLISFIMSRTCAY
jgi:hypothetical protein